MDFEHSVGSTSSAAESLTDEDMFDSSQSENVTIHENIPNCSRPLHKQTSLISLSLGEKERNLRGTPLENLPRNFRKDTLPRVSVSSNHTVLFKLPVKEGEVPRPWPDKPVDVWDQRHVRMPHSAHSLYPVTATELHRRWVLVEQSLCSSILTSHQLETAILHYNSKYRDRWDFNALHSFFSEVLEEIETEYFFIKVLPKIIDLALSLPNVVTNGIPLLMQHTNHSISLTQHQISCLLANAFLCTFPRRNTSKKNSEYSTYPDINFNRLFTGFRAEAKGRINSLHEKLKCIINYFRRVTTKVPAGVVTFTRHCVTPDALPVWSDQPSTLHNLYVSDEGTIEDGGTGMLEVDFANKFVGGGVLGCGCIQEEIRFVTYPELILAGLFTEVLDDMEALIVKGCERFNKYTGYANSFEWAGDFQDTTPRDRFGRLCCTVVAIDALRFANARAQYSADLVNRELNKAYAGFSCGMKDSAEESVATGNWGCGAFRGDSHLKSLLQLMAAATTGRHLAYFTFGDSQLRDSLANMHSFLVYNKVSVGNLWKIITSYSAKKAVPLSLYEYIYNSVNSKSVPKPSSQSPLIFKRAKLQKNESRENKDSKKVAVDKPRHSMTDDDIETALDNLYREDLIDNSCDITHLEVKTLNLQQDKESSLQRLSSSWKNLNESKKDFKPISPSENNLISNNCFEQEQNLVTSRKKKISDYFQSVPKT